MENDYDMMLIVKESIGQQIRKLSARREEKDEMYRVMVADDEPLMRKAMVSLTNWQELGCEVVYTAENGQQVMENLKEIKPDILITDIKMPGKDGIEIAKYIWEEKLPIKIILLTAYADFSYAQSAVKYNVVDYVTKTGAFDGLIMAINKAKDLIEKEHTSISREDKETVLEYFLKSIFDESIYDEEEIQSKMSELGMKPDNYLVLLLHFRLNEDLTTEKKSRTYKSLLNFFSMVFGEQMLRGIPVQRDMYAIVVQNVPENYMDTILMQGQQITDMMDNFMGLYVNIGVSSRQQNVICMKKAYDQAESVLGNSFISGDSKISFFERDGVNPEKYSAKVDELIEQLCFQVSQGNTEEVQLKFKEILDTQKTELCAANTIKNSGIIIQQRCRKILDSFGTDIFQVTGYRGSITEKIHRCFYADEYEKVMMEILQGTSAYVSNASSHKNTIVNECERYIEENFHKGITVTDIAEHVGTSISYLSRIYKEATGEKILNRLNQMRIEKAKDYLKNTDKKIYEIADALGFENTTYFSYFFKKYTGVSPKDFK